MKNQSTVLLQPLYKEKIISCIEKQINKKKSYFEMINTWGPDFIDKIIPFITRGKMIRGSLVLFTYQTYAQSITTDVITAAASIELFHSAFLIHDDIMDSDTTRRGYPTLFAQYRSFGKQKLFQHPQHFGESMALCVGDMLFFLGFELLNSIPDVKTKTSVVALYMREFLSVGLAQMQDVYAGHTKEEVSQEDIERLYLYKTARYTFSLPCMVGALCAKQSQKILSKWETLGENIGMMFQLKDDEIGIFGTEEMIGKPIASDIRENKKTLFRKYLLQQAPPEVKKKLLTIFGKSTISPEEITYVRTCIKTFGVTLMLEDKMKTLQTNAENIITKMPIPIERKTELIKFVTYLKERKK